MVAEKVGDRINTALQQQVFLKCIETVRNFIDRALC